MKVSNLLFLSFVASSLYASTFDDLKDSQKDILNYSYKQTIEDSAKLKKDWINPIKYSYIYNKDDSYTTKKSIISLSQPIFKSGGIWDAIKYSNATKKYSNLSIDIQKNELVKQVINLILQIKKLDISIKKQQFIIKNAQIDVKVKKEQVLNGILDTSFLNNAIIALNGKKTVLIDLQYQKDTFINNLKLFTQKNYDSLSIPKFTLIDKDDFLANNLYLQKEIENIDMAYWTKQMIKANYLPTVNLTASYSKYHDTGGNQFLSTDGVKNVGFNITIPLDIKTKNNIASNNINYIKSKIAFENQKIEQEIFYDNIKLKLNSIDKKIILSKEDYKLYDQLLVDILQLQNGGFKTKDDVDTMENSKKIKALDIESFKIDKQLELMELYFKLNNTTN